MKAAQINTMNTELWQSIGAIADSEPLMRRLTNYAKRLAKKRADETLISKEEFMASLDQGEEEYRQGKCVRLNPDESVTDMLRRIGR